MDFHLQGSEYIELIKLLKVKRIAESGGQAKFFVEEGEVKLNGEVETRKRAKLRIGDVIEVLGETVHIIE
jgi:ribosome-associated protein